MKKEVKIMMIDTNSMVPISAANQNFSKVAKMADEHGSVVIMKNNAPRYVLIDFSRLDHLQPASMSTLDTLAEKLMDENDETFRELAK